jgi:hypothetical protein
MTESDVTADTSGTATPKRYRLPGIQRDGVAQLSLLETALWPLQGGTLPGNSFETTYEYSTAVGRKTARVTVRAALGLQPIDELVLWGLLAATAPRPDVEPMLLATPYWLLHRLGLDTGGSQYAQLRDSLQRLALASYQSTAFYNPDTGEHEVTAFQFLSIGLPTVGGVGETVDNDRAWRIEWNAPFFRFCRAAGGSLMFDLDMYRQLSPAARRLFLKLKDRFWRSKRVFMNVEDLTINGLGFSAQRAARLRKFDLTNCMRELLEHHIIDLGRGQTDPRALFLKRSKGVYVVSFHEGDYFRQPRSERAIGQENAIANDPLYEPLRRIGVDGPGIRRLLTKHGRGIVQRWVRITDAAMHEKPRGFSGFRVSAAAFLVDGIENKRTSPDWFHAHEKRQREAQRERERALSGEDDHEWRRLYEQERAAAWQTYLASPEGREKYERAYHTLLAFHKVTEPHRFEKAAHQAALEHVERVDFCFLEYALWAVAHRYAATQPTE